jgi:DNA repair protein RAD16
MFLERSLRMHNWYFCGPNARRTEKQSKTEKRTAMMAKEKAMRTLRIKAGKASDVTEADINDEVACAP